MKTLYTTLALLIVAVFVLSACAPAAPTAAPVVPVETQAPEAAAAPEAVRPRSQAPGGR